MPSHIIPPGPDGSAARRLARRQRLLKAWQQLPILMLALTGIQVAGMPPTRGSALSQALVVVRAALVDALVLVMVAVAIAVVRRRVSARREPDPPTRPRWQYLLAALGSFAVASCLVVVGAQASSGLLARVIAAAGVWCGLYGLVMTGRAVCWGRARALLWWRPSRP